MAEPLIFFPARILGFSTSPLVYNGACIGGIILKRMLFAVGLAVFLGCTVTLLWMEWENPSAFAGAEHVVAQLKRQPQEPVALGMQRNLARWYNLNLYSAIQDPGFRDAYWDILDLSGHAMGYLSIPSLGLNMPIYHGTGEEISESGSGHVSSTAFPLGQAGEHTAITVPVPVEEGTYFYIHILQEVLAYQVTETEYAQRETADYPVSEEESLCTLVYGGGDTVKLLRGSLTPTAPQEQDIQVETETEGDGWLAASCVVLALGILLVPFLMLCRMEEK